MPLPASAVQTQNVLANDSKGLTKSQPQVKHDEPDAIPIPDKNAKIKPKPKRGHDGQPSENADASGRRDE